ncbi:hypothetical protein EDD21DRAFT_377606 [Dissophora ornata]|nr:hypothetical protein EDD21DRAFT_377606 [Dissophora ornata]
MELGAGINAGIAEARPRLDQIDFLGHEAEVDWLDEVEKMEMVGKANLERKEKKYHHHSISTKAMSEKHDGHGDTGGGAGGQGHEVKDRHGLKDAETDIAEDTKEPEHMRSVPPEKLLHDLQWEAEHGGLNPKHFHQGNQKMGTDPRSNNRAEEQDRDEDGIVFPEVHSDQPYSKIVYPIVPEDPDSTLGYVSYNRQGDRIMDFSMAGWNEGNTDLPDAVPDIPCLETLSPRDGADSPSDQGDDTERIQAALDRVSRKTKKLVQNKDVIPKGALALERGVYRISRPLKIRASGILFRGDPGGGSRIVCQWESRGPRYAIEVEGKTDKMLQNTRVPVMAEYTPVGSFFLALDPTYFQETGLSVGDQVVVSRIGNARWIRDIGMDDFHSDKKGLKPWKNMHAKMYRTIRYLNSQTGIVELDAPMPISISRQYGGGFVTKYKDGKIHALGIQYLDMVFPGNIGRTKEDFLDQEGRGSKDYRFSYEIFANYALRIDCAYHMYVSHITTAFFHNFVSVGTDVHHLTLDSIVHSYPDEMLSGQSAFQLSGQLVLVKDSLSQGSFHFFVDISHVMGPNVFFRSMCVNVGKPSQPMPLNFAPGEVGPHMKLCTGILVDQVVTDGPILLVNRGEMGTGHGYTSANSVVWNSRAREGILTHRAAGFQNFVIGSEDLDAMDRRPWDHHGWKEHLGSEVLPGSLYLRQLSDRLERLSKGWVA